ncbi:MAG TPA: acetone carboxylase subunit gamma [Dehalococcoidia bacterium]|nr:acetone carboxylase subunit gamma [Dehalococcoidia bacterium]
MRVHYYLEIDDDKKIKCLKCGRVICDASQNYKEHVPRAEVWPDEIPGERPTRENTLLLYYEYYCPGCYTMLDVELAERGAAPLWDIQVKV